MAKNLFYANNSSIAISDNDVMLTFRCIVPTYGVDYQVNGQEVHDEVSVQLSPEVFKLIMSKYNELYQTVFKQNE